MPYLEFEGDLRHLGPGVLTIGSGVESAWRILNHDLEAVHAIVTLERDGSARIAPRFRTSLIRINGAELLDPAAHLTYGDTVQLGSATLNYRQFTTAQESTEGYLRDNRRGRLYKLLERAEIGRDPHCEVLIQEPEVSRLHARVVRREGDFFVEPRTAVTLINGERLARARALREGDELIIGHTTLRFSHEVPRTSIAAASGSSRGGHSAHMPTTFIGVVETRNRIRRNARRKWAIAALAVGLAIIVAGLLLGRHAARLAQAERAAAKSPSSIPAPRDGSGVPTTPVPPDGA
jgi:pSer/pThr/pTyr-binding forkhead associated (FHA) protein